MHLRAYQLLFAFVVLSLAPPAAGDAAGCASAATLWKRGPAAAEAIARTCQAAAPHDADRNLALAQILAWQESHAEALAWIDLGLAHQPASAQLAALRLRILGWQGRFAEASAYASELPAEVESDADVARARADLARWQQGRTEQEDAYALLVQAGPVADDGAFGWIGRALLDARLGSRLHLGGSVELQERRFGGEPRRDSLLGMHGGFRATERVLLRGGAGVSIDPAFSPRWNAHAEVGLQAGAGFTFFLRYWHLEWQNAGVDVLSPAISWDGHGLHAIVRAWRGFEEDDASLSLLGRVTWSFHGPFDLAVGAGGGDRADYLVLRNDGVERHVLALAGLGWKVDPAYHLRADWVGRWERAGGADFRRDELLLGLRRTW